MEPTRQRPRPTARRSRLPGGGRRALLALGPLLALLALAAPAQAVIAVTPSGHVISYQRAAPLRTAATPGGSAAAAPRNTAGVPCTTSTSTNPCLTLGIFGGPVMRFQHVTPVYWDPSGAPAFPAGYESEINQFFGDLAAASATTDFVSVLTQYYDHDSYIGHSVTAGAPIVDTAPYPTAASDSCVDPFANSRTCVSDQGITDELKRLLGSDPTLPTGVGNEYIVFFPSGVDTCEDSGPTACGGVAYCGYHSGTNAPDGSDTEYAVEPENGDPQFGGGCDGGGGVGTDDAHATINTTSHEFAESITDPDPGSGWYDFGLNAASQQWGEIGDICAWTFTQGATAGSTSWPAGPSSTDQTINGHGYELQTEWDNANSTCSVSAGAAGSPAGPTSSFTGTPQTGDASNLAFADTSTPSSGSITAHQWVLGDGTTSTAAAPSHQYSTGTKSSRQFVVTETVTDSAGRHGTTSQVITVEDQAPTAAFTAPGATVAGTPLALNGLAGSSDADGTISSYAWSWSGPTAGNATGATPTVTFTIPGNYTLTLQVTDNAGKTATASVPVSVAPSSAPAPVAPVSSTPATTTTPPLITVKPATTVKKPVAKKKKKKKKKKRRHSRRRRHRATHHRTSKKK